MSSCPQKSKNLRNGIRKSGAPTRSASTVAKVKVTTMAHHERMGTVVGESMHCCKKLKYAKRSVNTYSNLMKTTRHKNSNKNSNSNNQIIQNPFSIRDLKFLTKDNNSKLDNDFIIPWNLREIVPLKTIFDI